MKLNANTIWVRGGRDRALDVTAWIIRIEEFSIWEVGDIDWTDGAILRDGRITQGAGHWIGCSLRVGETKEGGSDDGRNHIVIHVVGNIRARSFYIVRCRKSGWRRVMN